MKSLPLPAKLAFIPAGIVLVLFAIRPIAAQKDRDKSSLASRLDTDAPFIIDIPSLVKVKAGKKKFQEQLLPKAKHYDLYFDADHFTKDKNSKPAVSPGAGAAEVTPASASPSPNPSASAGGTNITHANISQTSEALKESTAERSRTPSPATTSTPGGTNITHANASATNNALKTAAGDASPTPEPSSSVIFTGTNITHQASFDDLNALQDFVDGLNKSEP